MQTTLRIKIPTYTVSQCFICLDHFSLVRHAQCPKEECIEQKRIELLEDSISKQECLPKNSTK